MVCNASYSFNLFNLDVRECEQMSYKLCQGEKNIRNSGSQIHKNSRRRSRTCFKYFKMQQKVLPSKYRIRTNSKSNVYLIIYLWFLKIWKLKCPQCFKVSSLFITRVVHLIACSKILFLHRTAWPEVTLCVNKFKYVNES